MTEPVEPTIPPNPDRVRLYGARTVVSNRQFASDLLQQPRLQSIHRFHGKDFGQMRVRGLSTGTRAVGPAAGLSQRTKLAGASTTDAGLYEIIYADLRSERQAQPTY